LAALYRTDTIGTNGNRPVHYAPTVLVGLVIVTVTVLLVVLVVTLVRVRRSLDGLRAAEQQSRTTRAEAVAATQQASAALAAGIAGVQERRGELAHAVRDLERSTSVLRILAGAVSEATAPLTAFWRLRR
jgi:hypothetical protein